MRDTTINATAKHQNGANEVVQNNMTVHKWNEQMNRGSTSGQGAEQR